MQVGAAAAACVNACDCPPAVIVVARVCVAVFGCTVNTTSPLPLPELVVMVVQAAPPDAVHAHPVCVTDAEARLAAARAHGLRRRIERVASRPPPRPPG